MEILLDLSLGLVHWILLFLPDSWQRITWIYELAAHIKWFRRARYNFPGHLLDHLTLHTSSMIQLILIITTAVLRRWLFLSKVCSSWWLWWEYCLEKQPRLFLTLFLQLCSPVEDRWSWASPCRSACYLYFRHVSSRLFAGSPAADAGAAVPVRAGAGRDAQVPVTQPLGGPHRCRC